MNHKPLASVLVLSVSLALRSEAAHHQAGGATVRDGQSLGQLWKPEPGEWQARLFASALSSDSVFGPSGASVPLENHGTFNAQSLNLFGEYTFSERWSASAYIPLQRSRISSDVSKESWTGLGDTYAWGRYRFDATGPTSHSLVLGVKVPGSYGRSSGLGDRQVDYDLQYLASRATASGGYVSFNSGYRVRLGDISDEVILGIQAGFNLGRGWMVVPNLTGVKGIGSGVNKDYANGGLTVIKTLAPARSLFFSYSNTFAGQNTVRAQVWSLGLAFRRPQ